MSQEASHQGLFQTTYFITPEYFERKMTNISNYEVRLVKQMRVGCGAMDVVQTELSRVTFSILLTAGRRRRSIGIGLLGVNVEHHC